MICVTVSPVSDEVYARGQVRAVLRRNEEVGAVSKQGQKVGVQLQYVE
jgi:hypothetical protein